MLIGLFFYEWKYLRKMFNKYDRILKLSSVWKYLRVIDNFDRLLLMGYIWIFSYWLERDKEFFGEFGFCYFMVYNRFVIVCIKVKSGKVCVSYKNFSGFIVSIVYKFCMEIFVRYLEGNFLKDFVYEDGIFIFWDVLCSSFYDFGDIFFFNIMNI